MTWYIIWAVGDMVIICNLFNVFVFLLYFPDYESFLLYSKVTSIESILLAHNMTTLNPPKEPIKPENADIMQNVIGLTFDLDTKRLFFSDIQRGDIYSVYFNNTGYKRIYASEFLLWYLDQVLVFINEWSYNFCYKGAQNCTLTWARWVFSSGFYLHKKHKKTCMCCTYSILVQQHIFFILSISAQVLSSTLVCTFCCMSFCFF